MLLLLRFIAPLVLSRFCILSHAQVWTVQEGATLNELMRGMETDADGNIYAAYITGGTRNIMGNLFSFAYDVAVIKLSSTGTILWERQESSSSSDTVVAIAVDSVGQAVVSGNTPGGFGGNSHIGGTDIYVMKTNDGASSAWIVQRGTTESESVSAMQLDSLDNVVVAGHTTGGLDGFSNAGGTDSFIIVFNSSGGWQWTYQTGSGQDDHVAAVQLDNSGSIVVAGETQGSLAGNTHAGGREGCLPSDVEQCRFSAVGRAARLCW